MVSINPLIEGKPRDWCMADLGSVTLEILVIGVDFCCMADLGTDVRLH